MNKCGFIALLGEPNAGKSTLLNHLVGTKVSIVSAKVQTTRRRILGIHLRGRSQLIFIDTPGIFEPKKRLERAMVQAAWTASGETDINVILIDLKLTCKEMLGQILERVSQEKKLIYVALTKSDLYGGDELNHLKVFLEEDSRVHKVFVISAVSGENIEEMLEDLEKNLPQGPWLYPEDQITDLPLRLLAAEMTREKVFNSLHQEVPYQVTVETEAWEEFKNGSIKVNQIVHVKRSSQKAILLGKGGRQIKAIGEETRKELQTLLGCPVHLIIYVRVTEAWMDDPSYYKSEGLDYKA